MSRFLSCAAIVVMLAMSAVLPTAHADDSAIADEADANANSASGNQVLELPQACTADGATFSCDQTRAAPMDAPVNPTSNAATVPQAEASAAADAADDVQIGSVRDYENQGITEAPLPPSALVTSGPPVTLSRSTFGPAGYSPYPPLSAASTYVPAPPFMMSAPVAMGRPVGSTAIGPAGAPMWGPSGGLPLLSRPFPAR